MAKILEATKENIQNVEAYGYNTGRRTLRGYQAMNMLRKGQIQDIEKGDILGQVEFVSQVFRVAA